MGKTSHKDIEYQKLLADAVALRLAKTPYDRILEKLGHWKSIQACQKAVAAYLRRNQTLVVEESRSESIGVLEDLMFELKAKFAHSKLVLIAREIRNLNHQINQLQGNYAPQKLAHEGKDGRDLVSNITVNVIKSAELIKNESDDKH